MGKLTLKDVVGQMTTDRGSTGLSLNELNHKLKKAADSGNPSQYDFRTVERPYNIVSGGQENYYPTNNNYQYNKEFAQNVADYLNAQMGIAKNYKVQKNMLDRGGYDDLQYQLYFEQLRNSTRDAHINLLNQLGSFLNTLSPSDLLTYHKTSVDKQLWLSSQLQYNLSSDKKKEYDRRINELTNKIQLIQQSNNGIDLHQIRNIVDSLTAERNNVINESNEYMNQCIRSNNGSPQQMNALTQSRQNNDPYNNIVTFGSEPTPNNTSLLNKPRCQAFAGDVVPAEDVVYDELKKMNEPTTYTPYYGENNSVLYNNQYNYLTNGGVNYNYLRNSNQNLASYKNKFIQEMRRIGFIPESFGDPINEDYIMQLIWVTPVADQNNYGLGYMSSPTWYLTPQQLGYKDYVEYNKDYLESIKNPEKRVKVSIYNPRTMTPEDLAQFRKEGELLEKKYDEEERKKKESMRSCHIIKLHHNEVEHKQEEKPEEKKLDPIELEEPDLTDEKYVLKISALEYVPEKVRKYLRNCLPSQLKDFCIDGLIYANKYRSFMNPYVTKYIDEAMQVMIKKYEDELVEKRGEDELEEEISNANKLATTVYQKLGGNKNEEISVYDVDKFEEIKELARKKLEALSKFDPEQLVPDKVKKSKLPKHMDELVDEDNDEEYVYKDPDDTVVSIGDRLLEAYKDKDNNDSSLKLSSYITDDDINVCDELENDFDEYEGYEDVEDILPYDEDDEDSLLEYLRTKKESLQDPQPSDYVDVPILDDGTTLEDAFDKLDTRKIEDKVELLKEAIRKNINATPFKAMTTMERLVYLREQVNGGLYDAIDMSKFKPGIHKFYTNKGIFVLDNRDFSVKDAMPLESLSAEYQYQYLHNGEVVVNAYDAFVNKLILPKIKPEDKEEFKNPNMDYDYNEYLNDLNILRKRDEIALGMWKLNNTHRICNLNDTAFSVCKNMCERTAEYQRLTGIDPKNDKMTYNEWAYKIIPYRKTMENKGKASTRAIQIYDVVSNYNFNEFSEEANRRLDSMSAADYHSLGLAPVPPRRDYGACDLSQDIFKERLKHTCNHIGGEKCYSTYTSGVVDMEKKTPPLQYTGIPNSIFL